MMSSWERALLAVSIVFGLLAVFWNPIEEFLASQWATSCPYLMDKGSSKGIGDAHRYVKYTNGVVLTGQRAGEGQVLVDEFVVDTVQGTFVENNESHGMTVDLGGALVTPGLVDPHVHFLSGGLALHAVQLEDGDEEDSLRRKIAHAVATKNSQNEWIIALNYRGEFGDRSSIDDVTRGVPTVVFRFDSHQILANTVALERASITRSTPDPAGGAIIRNVNGDPTGVLCDSAMGMVTRMIPAPTTAVLNAALQDAQLYAFRKGVTHVHDMGRVAFTEGDYAAFDDLQNVYLPAVDSGNLNIRLRAFVSIKALEGVIEMVNAIGSSKGRLSWGGVKEFFDGSLSSRTALMYEPYRDDQKPNTSGVRSVNVTEFEASVEEADKAGLQIAVHAIGSRAVDEVLNVYARHAVKTNTHRIEHAQHLSSLTAIDTMSKLGISVTPNPLHWVGDRHSIGPRLHEKDAKYSYALKEFASRHVSFGLASDWPVTDMDPMKTLEAAVNPDNPYALSLADAAWGITRGAVLVGDPNANFGCIQDGMQADFVIHAVNSSKHTNAFDTIDIPSSPFVSASKLKHALSHRVDVKQTYINGKCVYGCGTK